MTLEEYIQDIIEKQGMNISDKAKKHMEKAIKAYITALTLESLEIERYSDDRIPETCNHINEAFNVVLALKYDKKIITKTTREIYFQEA